MATTTKRLTVDDLEFIPEEREGDRHELIDGELIVTSLPVMIHQTISSNIAFALARFVRNQKIGRVHTALTGVRLADDTLVVPDVCFVTRDRLEIIGERTIDGPPDLIVEILSPDTRQRDVTGKRSLYARFGVREYWIVDPDAKTVLVLALNEDRYEEVPPVEYGTIVSRVLPGLQLGLDEVFADVP